MEMNNHCCCQNPGLKLGQNKTQITSPSVTPAVTTTASTTSSASQSGASNTSAAGQKRIFVPGYAQLINYGGPNMRGNFKLPGYEPTTLKSLPVSPQTLFQKNQLLNMLKDFSKHMYDSMLQNNIQWPSSLTLGLDSQGNINVLGNPADKAQIESLFANNSSLATQFHQIAFMSRAQQLANMQPDFTNAFFQLPTNSYQQINFVQMRAFVLGPFQITINPPNNTAGTGTVASQTTQGMPFHLQISKSAGASTAAATSATATPTPTTETTPAPEISPAPAPVIVSATTPVATPAITDSSAIDNQTAPIADQSHVTIDDPTPPITAQPEPQHAAQPQHPATPANGSHGSNGNHGQIISDQHRFTIDNPAPPVTNNTKANNEGNSPFVNSIKEMGLFVNR